MLYLQQLYVAFRDFMEAGGIVLWPVLAVAILLWTLIIERYWYFWFVHPHEMEKVLEAWQSRRDTRSWYARRIRERMLSEEADKTYRFVAGIKLLIALVPLLGLLGTVTGMVQVFEVMASMGTSNPRAMASGISAAIYPTMAAMTIAISGLYFSAALERRAGSEIETLSDNLRAF